MQAKLINSNFSVTGQIFATDINQIVTAGFKSIICNRPDGESSDQPAYAEIEAAAKQAGLQIRYIPIIPGQTSETDVSAFGLAMAELPKPVLAYCRTGARSTMLWDMTKNLPKQTASTI